MTTTVMIMAASWPVLVTAIDHQPGSGGSMSEDAIPPHDVETELFTVEPGKHANSYVTSTRELRITEMPAVSSTFLDRLKREHADLVVKHDKLGEFLGHLASLA